MFRRRVRDRSGDLPVSGFLEVLDDVERAKEAIVAAVPTARAPGAPLADALFEFERGLRAAAEAMPRWRHDSLAREWAACDEAIADAIARGERLRLEAPELGFESLIGRVGDLIAPLDAFGLAAERFRDLGSRLR